MSPRLPGRHDQPVTPLEMSDADIMEFGRQIATGFDGKAQWRRKGQHEQLVIWLHPDAVNYLPPGTYVIATGNKVEPIGPDGRGGTLMGVQFLLGRDFDSGLLKVVRSGVREDTDVFTSPPEGDEQ